MATNDFHLVTEEAGRLVVHSFNHPSNELASWQWLDERRSQPGPVHSGGLEILDCRGETLLAGGRLLLTRHMVLDVETLALHPIRAWVDGALGLDAVGEPALALSPRATQFAAIGRLPDEPHDEPAGLVVVDIASGRAYAVPIDRVARRALGDDAPTPAWFAQHFRWISDDNGRERLIAWRTAPARVAQQACEACAMAT